MLRLALATAVALLISSASAIASGTLEIAPVDGAPRTLVARSADGFGAVTWTAGGITALEHGNAAVKRHVFAGPPTPVAELPLGHDSTLSPDGRFVVTGDEHVAVHDATTGARIVEAHAPRRHAFGSEAFSRRCWSRDGNRVAIEFASDTEERSTTVVLDTRARRVVRRSRLSLTGWNGCFSPDGSRLLASRAPFGEVGVLDITTGRYTRMRAWGRSFAEQATWSPAGMSIGVLTDDSLVVADAVTGWGLGHPVAPSGSTSAASGSAATGFVWSPDGTRLAYVELRVDAKRRKAVASLMVLRVDVPTPPHALITARRGTFADYAWAPDGQRLAVTTSSEPMEVVSSEVAAEFTPQTRPAP